MHVRYALINKDVGETPLQALERYRSSDASLKNLPLAYAGRLDPMASGLLLILIGDECKRQERYHALDKKYEFEVLFGVGSDTGDVLGILSPSIRTPHIEKMDLDLLARSLSANKLSLPYPTFSAKTVKGKPLHVWTLEGRLDEIEIPVATTTIYKLQCMNTRVVKGDEIYTTVQAKIETIPPVTDTSKALGADFRRDAVRASWQTFHQQHKDTPFTIARFSCICSSGTYMRSLAEHIALKYSAQDCKLPGLAYSINRTRIGLYRPIFGFERWKRP